MGVGPGHSGSQNSVAETVGGREGWSRGERPACFLGANDEELREAVTRLLLGPDVFVAFVFAGVLKQQWKGWMLGGPENPVDELPLHVDMWLPPPCLEGFTTCTLVTSLPRDTGLLGYYRVSVTTTQLCCCSLKAATGRTYKIEHGWVSIELYL